MRQPRWGSSDERRTSLESGLTCKQQFSLIENSFWPGRTLPKCSNGEHDDSDSAMNSVSTSFLAPNTQPTRRSSVSSRLSFAVSSAEERGDNQNGPGIAAEHQIEEEIAKIKRYEVQRISLRCRNYH